MLVALASAKGAPGVSTTAVALGSVWPTDVVVVDADAAGGDLGYRLRTSDGRPLDHDRGLLGLAAEARRGLTPRSVADQVQTADGGLDVLLGVERPEQVAGLGPVWTTVAGALAGASGPDVLADCGRIAPGTPLQPLLSAAHAVIVCVEPSVEAYAHLRDRLRWLLHTTTERPPAVGVVLRSAWSDTAAAADLEKLLAHSGLSVPVLGRIAEDARAADVLAGRTSRGIGRSLLVRSARSLVDPVRTLATTRPRVHAQP
ncbi:hypothetical protein [Sanguibacter suaedae]|uniref:MinD-like ATPase involved in chromosome partitioning or flagellar assembly n=1 Tax=Sanguibacter suaedae TaxID=2795737 RepID=A0A934ICH5_9MICO|nr:hypothetical protein [Sanguibacter suaedae]MBI9115326.1 hypothetical protein [Sanguibacter suaedae]